MSHSEPGTPKRWCESFYSEMLVHEYVGFGYFDDDGIRIDASSDDGRFAVGAHPHTVVEGRVDGSRLAEDRTDWDCYRAGDLDGHSEFAVGGAILAAYGGLGGAQACLGEDSHHSSYYPTVYVEDAILGAGVEFHVAADWPRTGDEALFPCGDGILEPCPFGYAYPDDGSCNPRDMVIRGIGSQFIPFGSGAAGGYIVFVEGIAGHIWST